MVSRRLVLGITDRQTDAAAVANELSSLGIVAFVSTRPWEGQLRSFVGYHAQDGAQAALLEAVFEALQIEGEIIFDELPGDDNLTPVYSSFSPEEAHLMANLLERSGVEAQVVADQASHTVLVPRRAEPTALAVVAQFQESRKQALEPGKKSASLFLAGKLGLAGPGSADDHDWPGAQQAWPCCPQCSKPRDTRCPKCRETGSHFPAAELVPAEFENDRPPPDRLANAAWPVICPLCDWLFEPRHYRQCAWCGHDFENGIETPRLRELEEIQLNLRMALVTAFTVALIVGLLIYLVAIGRGKPIGEEERPPRRPTVADRGLIAGTPQQTRAIMGRWTRQ